jgi:hypothetical protein
MILTELEEVFINGKELDLKESKMDALKIKELFRSWV